MRLQPNHVRHSQSDGRGNDPENSHGANYATKPRPRSRSQPRADRDRQAASTSRSCSGVRT